MKKGLINVIVSLFIGVVFLSCSRNFFVRDKNTLVLVNRIFEKQKIDTVFSYQSSNLEFLWFYKDNKLHSYMMKDYKIKKYQPITANFINVQKSDMGIFFNNTASFEDNCFYDTDLDGESIGIYVKNKEKLTIGFNLKCLTKTKYEINSFPYKIQYDFSKIFRPEGYSFEEMYGKEE